jgi:hypothetical protein
MLSYGGSEREGEGGRERERERERGREIEGERESYLSCLIEWYLIEDKGWDVIEELIEDGTRP